MSPILSILCYMSCCRPWSCPVTSYTRPCTPSNCDVTAWAPYCSSYMSPYIARSRCPQALTTSLVPWRDSCISPKRSPISCIAPKIFSTWARYSFWCSANTTAIARPIWVMEDLVASTSHPTWRSYRAASAYIYSTVGPQENTFDWLKCTSIWSALIWDCGSLATKALKSKFGAFGSGERWRED